MSRDLYSQVSVLFIRHLHSCGAATALVGDGEDVVERRVDLNSSLGTQSIRSRKQNEEGLIHNSNSSPFSLKAAEFLCLLAPCQPLDCIFSPFHPQKSFLLNLKGWTFFSCLLAITTTLPGSLHYVPGGKKKLTKHHILKHSILLWYLCVCPLPAASSIPSSWTSQPKIE